MANYISGSGDQPRRRLPPWSRRIFHFSGGNPSSPGRPARTLHHQPDSEVAPSVLAVCYGKMTDRLRVGLGYGNGHPAPTGWPFVYNRGVMRCPVPSSYWSRLQS
jgi:hypothetical protein